MKPISTMTHIVPIGEFKARASRIVRELAADRRPVVVTLNGRAAGVLISPEDFDRLTERERFVTAVEQGLRDSVSGDVLDDAELDAALALRVDE